MSHYSKARHSQREGLPCLGGEDLTSRREKVISDREIDLVVDFLKTLNEEFDHNKDSPMKNIQQSFNSQTQKAILTKVEENKVVNRVNFQALFALEEKESKAEFPMRILRDSIEEEDKQSNDSKISQLLKEMENYKDVLLESSLCKTNEDKVILDLYLTISRESFSLYSQQDKRMQSYFNSLKEVHYPSDLNENLMNVNNYFLSIESISAPTEDSTLGDSSRQEKSKVAEDKDYIYDYDDIEEDNSDHSSDSNLINANQKEANSDDDICELEEVNVEIKNKLIFNEDSRKDIKLKVQPNDSLFIPNDAKYTKNKKHLNKLSQMGFDNIITVINTDKQLLPFGLSHIGIEELMRYIANMDNSNAEKDLYVLINGSRNGSKESMKTYTEGDEEKKKEKMNKYFRKKPDEANELTLEEKLTIQEQLNKSEINAKQLKRWKMRNKNNLQ